jgi:phage host-nuclease inhibitor protein Gam
LSKAINDVAVSQNKSTTQILGQLNTTASGLNTRITGLQNELAQTEKDILAQVARNEAAGQSRDTALQNAITSVANAQNKSTADLTGRIGALGTQLGQEITSLQTRLTEQFQAGLAEVSADTQAKYDSLSAQQKADVALLQQQGIRLEDAINTKYGELQQQFQAGLAGVSADAQAKYDSLSAQQKADVGLLQQQGIRLEDAINTKYGELQQQFQTGLAGVTADAQAKYDQLSAQQKTDVALLQQQGIRLEDAINTKYGELQQQFQTGLEGVTGKLATLDETTRARFNQLDKTTQDFVLQLGTTKEDLTGLINTNYGQLQQQITGVQTGLGEQITGIGQQLGQQLGQQITGVQTGLQAQLAQQAQQAQRQSNVTQLFNMLSQPGALSQKVEVKAAEPVRLGPMFDISGESIFGAGQQLFTPYSAGGAVNYDEITDELVKIIRG